MAERLTLELKGRLQELLDQRKSVTEICTATGVSRASAYYYKKKKEESEKTTEDKKQDLIEKIEKMVEKGFNFKEISRELHVSKRFVEETSEKYLREMEDSETEEAAAERLTRTELELKKRWHWDLLPKADRRRSKDGYRIVYKGEKSNFRTPYRPDGIWR